MGKVIVFVPKSDHDRKARLIREARAIYENIFPTGVADQAHPDEADSAHPERIP
jgi:hypothetical protein